MDPRSPKKSALEGLTRPYKAYKAQIAQDIIYNFHTRADNDYVIDLRFPFGMYAAISRELHEDCASGPKPASMSIRLISKAM